MKYLSARCGPFNKAALKNDPMKERDSLVIQERAPWKDHHSSCTSCGVMLLFYIKPSEQNVPIVPIQLVGKEETKKVQLIQEHSFATLE